MTLVELMVAMTVGVVVLLAVLQAGDLFRTTANTATQLATAQDGSRAAVRDMVSFLRQGRVATGQTTPIPSQWTPSRSDLVVAAWVAGDGTVSAGDTAGWVRYCVATSGGRSSLLAGVRNGDAYAAPGPCAATDTTNNWRYATVVDRQLANPTALFDFTASTCTGATCLPAATAVQAVGIGLAVTRSTSTTAAASVVRDAVSFRNRG